MAVVTALLMGVVSVYGQVTTPMSITFEAKLATQTGGLLQGNRDVRIRIGNYNSKKTLDDGFWEYTFKDTAFYSGVCSILISDALASQKPFDETVFNIENPYFQITVDGLDAYFPIPSAPYAVQARVAEEVNVVRAEMITGEFVTSVNISSDLIVDSGTLYVDSKDNKVGVGTLDPSYQLDVVGTINAQGYKINGVDIESALSWKRRDNDLYYLQGNVGLGTTEPAYALDVVGTINAMEYYKDNVKLEDYLLTALAWRDGPHNSIYFNDGSTNGKVSIGASLNAKERLNVYGGIRIGESIQTIPKAGTIEFSGGDFWGYVSEGEKRSLTGILPSETMEIGQVAIWDGGNVLGGTSSFVFKSGKLGVGTDSPEAMVDIWAEKTDTTLFQVQQEGGIVSMRVDDQGRIAMGKSEANYALDVNGIIDATDYYVNGVPLSQSFSDGSFWLKGNNDQIFYDLGNVGIGTSEPRNLLELSSVSDNAGLTFDIQGRDLFTMGVTSAKEDAFILSQGSDLLNPIFVFSGTRIGVGTLTPKANLHVSGNLGFLATGQFGSSEPLPVSGEGTRLLWYPGKAAFRAGYVLGTKWDDEQLGKYSVAMGYDPIASGEASAAVGGYKGSATGENAVVLGGFENEATGKNSFAAGHKAKAKHDGVFVWADYTPTADAFTSSVPNQFLIRANGGMGIGTTDTTDSVLTVKRNYPGQHLLVMGSKDIEKDVVVVDTNGAVGIGTSEPGTAKLAVENGNVGFGTTDPLAQLTIQSESTVANIVEIYSPNVTDNAVFVISPSGNVGIGVENPQARLDVGAGKIIAGQFLAVDPDDPSSVVVLQPSSGSPWADPSDPVNNNNTFRAQGHVGIGTPSPNSLLELSDRSEGAYIPPVITFDINGTDAYSMGVITDNVDASKVYFAIQPGGDIARVESPFLISTSSVGIGIGMRDPVAHLEVSGNTVLSGNVAVGTTNVTSVYNLLIEGALNVSTLNIGGSDFIPQPSPWRTSGLDIYYTSGNVGIGTDEPSVAFEVNGTVSVNHFIINDEFELDGQLLTDVLLLKDISNPVPTYGALFVENADLKYREPSTNIVKTISSPLQKGTNVDSGPLAFWIDDSTVGVLPVFWDNDKTELAMTGNLHVNAYRLEEDDGFSVSSDIKMGAPHALAIETELSHRGPLSAIPSYTGQKLNVVMNKDWGNDTQVITVRGLDISMQQDDSSMFLNRASAVGLHVDVSDVQVDEASLAQKFAAVFLGGNVGIGVDNPQTALEVNGIVSANFFNLSGGLDVPNLTVNKDYKGLVAQRTTDGSPRVGIGTLTPSAELEVAGLVSVNKMVVSGGLESTTLNVGNGNFVVDPSGNIGIGTVAPSSHLELSKQVDSALSNDFVSEKIGIVINAAQQPGFSFELNNNLTALEIDLSSSAANKLATGKTAAGISLNMSALNLDDGANAVGLKIDVSGANANAIRHAALFTGGYVGIGTTDPQADLHVSGDIRATNMYLEGNLQSERVTVNELIVHKTASINAVTVNRLAVLDEISAETLSIQKDLSVPKATFTTLNVNIASINVLAQMNDVVVDTVATINTLHVVEKFGVGMVPPSSGLHVSGNIEGSSMTLSEALNLNSATLNVNSGALFVGSSGYVGVGTSEPQTNLHIEVKEPASGFDPLDSDSWNAIRIQSLSDQTGVGAGLILVPDDSTPSDSIGSGIIAVRTKGFGSHLVFVTDPEDDKPKERVRFTSEGLLGIGTETPRALVDVAGDMMVDGSITINGRLGVLDINGINGVTLNPNGVMTVLGTTSINAAVLVEESAGFKELEASSHPTSRSGYGQLFADSSTNDLLFLSSDGRKINISKPYSGTPDRVPYFDADGSLSDDASFFWDSQESVLQVGTLNAVTSFEVRSTLDSSVSSMSLDTVDLRIGDRSSVVGGPATLLGVDVALSSYPEFQGNPTSFGRLANGETAIGLRVDVSDVVANYSISGVDFQGHKYAATFLGGNVGIGTTAPEAALHIGTDIGGPLFRVDTSSLENALIVSENGFVGLGTDSPTALLDVRSFGDQDDVAFRVVSGNKVVLQALNKGFVGINTDTPTAELDVNGVVSANRLLTTGFESVSLNIGSGAFVVDDNGVIGVGTENPTGQFEFYKAFTTNASADPFVSKKMSVVVDGDAAKLSGGSFTLGHDLTGLMVQIETADGNTIGNDTTSARAEGISVNMSSLQAADSSVLVGLDVDVTGEKGTRYAALLNGGYVGIDVDVPSSSLHVSGDIRADNLILSGAIDAGHLTANSLYVSDEVTLQGSVTVNAIYAETVSADSVVVNSVLTVSTASYTTVTVNQDAILGQLGIGVDSPEYALDVSGSVGVTGDLDVQGSLSVDEIKSDGIVTFNFTSSGGVYVSGNLDVKKNLTLGKGMRLATSNIGILNSAYSQLYVDSQGQLHYMKPNATSQSQAINLLSAFVGTPGRVPFYGDDGNISTTANMYWDDSKNILQVGTGNIMTSMTVVSTLNAGVTGELAGQKISLRIGDRSGAVSEATLTGMDIQFESDPKKGESGFGRLAAGEVAVGLRVDVSNVEAKSSTALGVDDVSIEGYKYAGIFNGGNVGIGTAKPVAALHVGGELSGPALRVDTKSRDYAMVVSDNGNVGIGIENPSTRLEVQGEGLGSTAAFRIVSGNTVVMHAQNNGKIGIGTASPTTELEVIGVVSANVGQFGGIDSVTMNIGNGVLVVDEAGEIGIGTSNPTGQFHFYKKIAANTLTKPFTSQKVALIVDGDPAKESGGSFELSQSLTGVDLAMSTAGSNTLGDATNTVVGTGVSVNMSSLTLGTGSKAIGLDVDVSGTGGTRYAAIFKGGNVGIGTETPGVALDVVGDVKATGLILSGDMTVGNLTANSVYVAKDVTINGQVTVNRLYADLVSANQITVDGELSISTATFTSVTVNSIASIERLGIGVNDLTKALVVSGDAKVTGDLEVVGTLNVTKIASASDLLFDLGSSNTVQFDGIVSINNFAKIGGALRLATQNSITASQPFGQVYVDGTGQLKYMYPNSATEVNLLSAFTGTPGRVPFYGDDGNISTTANMYWDDSKNILQVGTGNIMTSMTVVSTLNAGVTGELAGQKISLRIGDRSGAVSEATLTGMDIQFESDPKKGESGFGRLAAGEVAVGLRVDVSNVEAKSSTALGVDDVSIEGYKYAGIFNGGNVGIGTAKPVAALHVGGELSGPALRVDTKSRDYAMVVSDNGNVGIGIENPSTRLEVQGEGLGSTAAFRIVSGNTVVMHAQNNGKIGIGTASPTTELEVIGVVSANVGQFGGIDSVTMNIGNGVLVVDEAGEIGIGTSNPTGQFHFYKKIAANTLTKPFTSQKVALIVDGDPAKESGGSFELSQSLTGVDLAMSTAGSNTLGDATNTVVGTGVSVNMSSLTLGTGSKAIGLDVDVSGTGGTRYAAIFKGGNVGIGTETPGVALDVVGDVKATGLILSGDMTVGNLTANSVYVAKDVTINGQVTVNRLYADLVSANQITVDGELSISTATFTSVTVNSIASIERLGIGVNDLTKALVVSGDAKVTGDLEVVGTLNVNTLYTGSNLTIDLSDTGIATFKGTVSVNKAVKTGVAFQIPTQSAVSLHPTLGQLYVDALGDLIYVRPNSSAHINLLSAFIGESSRLPYYNASGSIASTANMYWLAADKRFQVGTANVMAGMDVISQIDNSLSGDISGQKIDMKFGARTGDQTSVFKGMNVVMRSHPLPSVDNFNFGRLANGETAIGLNIDLTDLSAKSSTSLGHADQTLTGFKYAALFKGGSVGIGTDTPDASLHVGSEVAGPAFRVDTRDVNGVYDYALYVTANGNVGIGTSLPTSKLTIKHGVADSFPAFEIKDASTRFVVSDKVGVGTASPKAMLHVDGTIPFIAGTTAVPKALVVSKNSYVGVHTDEPSANFHVVGDAYFDNATGTTPVVIKSGKVGIGITNPAYELSINGIANVIATKSIFTGKVPSWMADKGKGLLTTGVDDFTFFGLNETSTGKYDSVVVWGGDSADKFQFVHYNSAGSGTTTNIMTLIPPQSLHLGRVGIGDEDPEATLHVSGNFVVKTDTGIKALMVTDNGNIAIGQPAATTENITDALRVYGTAVMDELNILNGNVVLSTMNLTGYLQVDSVISESKPSGLGYEAGHIINVVASSDINSNIIGLEIKLNAETNTTLQDERKYTLWDANAYGLKVDLTELEVRDPLVGLGEPSAGHKYAAVFKGGPVGIGVDLPSTPLQVQGPFRGAIAKFGTRASELVIRDYDGGTIGLNVVDVNGATAGQDAPESEALILSKDKVGIGVTNPDKRLVVNGDMRVGTIHTPGYVEEANTIANGNRLYLSGGPRMGTALDGDNGDEIFLARHNVSEKISELRVNFSTILDTADPSIGKDKFIIGYDDKSSGAYKNALLVTNEGFVGISGGDNSFTPKTSLHVKGTMKGTLSEKKSHVAVIENSSSKGANTLGIIHTGLTPGSNIPDDVNFISFINGVNILGEIEGNNGLGVRYKTNGGDYAEYLPKLDTNEVIEKGDIVGVINGKISKSTKGAQQLLVKSTAAAVAGNWPGEDKTGYELIAFFGQVKVKVIGKVSLGDYIIPSGRDDGTGIAVSRDSLQLEEKYKIIGRAWSASDTDELSLIHVAVGFGFSLPSLEDDAQEMKQLTKKIEGLETRHETLEKEYKDKFDKQDAEFKALMDELSALTR